MNQSQTLHPAAKLLNLVTRRDLTIPGKCESDLWRAVWRSDRERRCTHVRIIAPVRLADGQKVETLMALTAEGLGGVMTTDTATATEFHFREKFAFTAELREEEDEQGRARFVNMAMPFQLGRPLDFFPSDGAA